MDSFMLQHSFMPNRVQPVTCVMCPGRLSCRKNLCENAMGMLESGTRAEQLNCLGQALTYCAVQEALICTSTAPQALIHTAYYVMSCVRIAPSAGMLPGIHELSSLVFTFPPIYSFSLVLFLVLLLQLQYYKQLSFLTEARKPYRFVP